MQLYSQLVQGPLSWYFSVPKVPGLQIGAAMPTDSSQTGARIRTLSLIFAQQDSKIMSMELSPSPKPTL